MAIWDNVTASANCPTCGDSLRFDPAIKASVCRSCGNVYEAGTLNYTGKFKFVDIEPASEAEENKREYVCGSCGATVVTNENTAATFCAFCGSPSLVSRRLNREFRPDYIIPFSIDENKAKELVDEWLKTNKKITGSFKKKAKSVKLTGLYVPFWLMNAECHAVVSGLGFVSDSATGRAAFNFMRKILFKVKNVPFDGCIGISNFLMNSIEPFDFEQMKEYDDVYLPGYYAYRYDRNALQMTDIIDIRLSGYAKQVGEMFAKSKTMESETVYNDAIADASDSYIKNLSQSYALLPVWFITVKYKGNEYNIAVNGQTGKVGGDVPEKEPLLNGFYYRDMIVKAGPWALAIVSMVVICILLLVLVDLPFYMESRIFVSALGMLLVSAVGYFKLKLNKAVKDVNYTTGVSIKNDTDVSDYFDYSYTPRITDRQDTFIGMQIRRMEGTGRNAHYSDWDWI